MHRVSFLNLTFLVVLYVSKAHASVASNWTNPSAHLPSFASTFLVGERILLSWLSLNISRDDLWLTRYDDTVDGFSLRIASDIDISVDGSFAWTIALRDEEVLKDTRFEFQFVSTNSYYDANAEPQLASPAFNIMLVNQATAPNGTVGAVASATSSSTSSTSDFSTTASPTPTPYNDHPGIGAGTIAGAAVGVLALVGFSGFAVGFWVFKKRQIRHNPKKTLDDSSSDVAITGPYEILGDRKHPVEVNGKQTQVYELNNSKETIVHEPDSSIIQEVGNTLKRPGLHEMPG